MGRQGQTPGRRLEAILGVCAQDAARAGMLPPGAVSLSSADPKEEVGQSGEEQALP